MLLLLPSIFPSIGVFSNESSLQIRWPTYWSFSFINSTSNEYWGLISFRIEWFDLLAVQGILKSLFQHHISKALILWCSVSLILSLILWCPALTSVHDYWKTSPTATDQPHDLEKLLLMLFPSLGNKGKNWKNSGSLWLKILIPCENDPNNLIILFFFFSIFPHPIFR